MSRLADGNHRKFKSLSCVRWVICDDDFYLVSLYY